MIRWIACFLLCSRLFSASWTLPDTITTTSIEQWDVFCSFDPSTGQFLATWGDRDTYAPMYAFYIPGTGWTDPPLQISSGTVVGLSVITAYIPSTGQFLAAWADEHNDSYPTYSLYTPGPGWSAIDTIANSSPVSENVYLSFDSNTGQVLATWSDDNTNLVDYALYTPGTGWSAVNTIASSTNANSVITSFDSITGKTLAAWFLPDSPNDPYYSVYTPGSGWSVPDTISTDINAGNNVYLSFDPTTGKTLATWPDVGMAPYYALYTPGTGPGTGWSAAKILPGGSEVLTMITTCFDPILGRFLAAWGASNDGNQAIYAIYTPATGATGWNAPDYIVVSPESLPRQDIFLSFDASTAKILGTWGASNNNNYPTYAFFTAPPPPDSPTGFRGVQNNNNFAIVSERYNTLSWNAASELTGYYLYRNGQLIATLSGNAHSYVDHDQPKRQQTYALVAFNGDGESSPVTISVGANSE